MANPWVIELPPEHAARCLQFPRRYIAGWIAISPILLITFGCCCVSPLLISMGPGGLGAIVGVVGMITSGVSFYVVAFCYNDYGQSQFYWHWLSHAIAIRPDAVADANDWFIERIHRNCWGHAMYMENADEIGFLAFDDANRRVLYEGNSERWIVPADAVLEIKIECLREAGDFLGVSLNHIVVLWLDTDTSPMELPICLRHADLTPSTPRRRRHDAEWLADRIRECLGR